ncbi:unnamed protein product [Rhizophagus irregularis]|nr:unnamed protein product [Rhizophagus irregularis]
MPIIHVRVSYKSVILKDWEGLPVEKETKIKDFFGNISILYLSPDWWDAEFEVKFSPSKTSEMISHRISNPINAFDILKASSNDLFVPEFNDSPRNALEKLRLDLSNWVKNNGGGLKGKDAANSIGKKFVTDLASVLWYVDSCSVETLDQKFKIPVTFYEFFGRSFPENYKSSRPKFSSEELTQQSKKILNYVELNWMQQSRFNWLKESLAKFGEILAKYSEYLEHQQIQSKEIKNSLIPIVDKMEAGSMEIYLANIWRNPANINKYCSLTNKLEEVEFWKPVNVNEFCPNEKMKRHRKM